MSQAIEATPKPYLLTKSRVVSGLQCPKKLWLDLHQPIKQDLHIFYIGNRFGEFARTHYGPGVDLTRNLDALSAIAQTQDALNSPGVQVIYEAAFLHDDTLVRVDVLIRHPEGWEIVEVKSSTKLKDEHIKDASIQAYIAKACGINIIKIQIAHINNTFVYQGNRNYDGFLIEVDITNLTKSLQSIVPDWIASLKPFATTGAADPEVAMGEQCTKPYNCPYQGHCSSLHTQPSEVPINILPNLNKDLLKEFEAKNIRDLRDIPLERLSNSMHIIIHRAHTNSSPWLSPKTIAKINELGWPRYFMDFETVQQGVPMLKGTKAYDALPFQWSVHRWDNPEQILELNDALSFLEFFSPNMDRQFLGSLIDAVGTKGPIFVHNASFERSKLRALIKRSTCIDLTEATEALITRIVDTLDIAREGFYAPQMMGSYSLKSIVKGIPTAVDYSNQAELSGGGDAQIAWFKCTETTTPTAEKLEWEQKLKKYCSQDTLAMYDFIKYLCD